MATKAEDHPGEANKLPAEQKEVRTSFGSISNWGLERGSLRGNSHLHLL
ncbi:MAG: hypothetical protein J6K31_12475 [Parabacteroides sp.]|nr:hypothetical protein [Parabacteroides sp.]